MDKLIVNEIIDEAESEIIPVPFLDGFHINRFKDQLRNDGESENTIAHMVGNARSAIGNLKNPNCSSESFFKPLKILCIGKVQSGKTSFFLGSIALAFDNGYDVVYLLGGTKLSLKKQNLGRVQSSFANNEKVKVFDAVKAFDEDVRSLVNKGFKVILVILKNAAKDANLGLLKSLASEYGDMPSLVIDDEGDEFSPGVKNSTKTGRTKRGGRTHDDIVDVISLFRVCTYLSVTATPQANLLISTLDGLSPNRIVLVQPGVGYTGGREFFDSKENKHVTVIRDADDFVESIPDSYKEAFTFFVFACALKVSKGDRRPYSMLVHPSSFNRVQNIVAERISNYFEKSFLPCVQTLDNIQGASLKQEMRRARDHYLSINPGEHLVLDEIISFIPEVLQNISFNVMNFTSQDTGENDKRYAVKIGGNLLGRGLTINRLIVSYIYRDSNVSMVDTMYQRCRWFGYKRNYFDVCSVYMTKSLQEKFIDIVANEDDMWIRLQSFLDSETDAKRFKRLFELKNDRLLLTRRTVSNTVTVAKITSGNRADRCIGLTPEQKKNNRSLIDAFKLKHHQDGVYLDFDNSPEHNQRHLIIETTFSEFFNDYLSKAAFGFRSPFSRSFFERILEDIHNGMQPDKLIVMIMRDGKKEPGETRSPSSNDSEMIDELFQGRNDNTEFEGDRWPVDFINRHDFRRDCFIQVHMIRTSDLDPYPACFPILSFNNPVTAQAIRLVTGENTYGTN